MMKLRITVIILTLFYSFADGQAISNGGFEDWTGSGKNPPFDWEEPTGWSSANPMTEFSGASTRRTSPGNTGDSACQINTANLFNEATPGFIVNGAVELNFSTFTADYTSSGTPVTQGYEFLHGYYKFSSTSNDDSAYVKVLYKKWNAQENKSDTVVQDSMLLAPATSFTEFQLEINGAVFADTDSVIILIASTNPNNPKLGGELIVDDIVLDQLNSTGHYPSAVNINIYPNPAEDHVTISTGNNEQISSIQVIDITGKTVMDMEYYNTSEAKLEVVELKAGIYFVQVQTNKGIVTRKLTIRK